MKYKFKQFLSSKRVINVVENARLFKCPIVCIYPVLLSKFSVGELRSTSKSNRSTSESTSLRGETEILLEYKSFAATANKKFDQLGIRVLVFKYASRDALASVHTRKEERGRGVKKGKAPLSQ